MDGTADVDNALPRSMRLEPNYPNPFNSGTVIRFSLVSAAQVELSLYNVAGQRVRSLVRGSKGQGIHEVRWDGRDESGRNLSSGVYFCRLSTGSDVQSRKLLLLR